MPLQRLYFNLAGRLSSQRLPEYGLLLALLLASGNSLAQAPRPVAPDRLGAGLLVLSEQHPDFFRRPVALYQDSLARKRLFLLSPERTTCPTCLLCAEPTEYYKGPVQPFSCGGGYGIAFICHRATRRYRELAIDTLGRRAYLLPSVGTFYTWNDYMKLCARRGDYFQFVRQWDRTVLYNQPYDLRHLPPPSRNLLVGLRIPGISDVKFYPVLVQGYWLKLRYTRSNGTTGTCWVVWRNAARWLIGFRFRSLD